jgi:Iap family predicted aminopeptidase
MHYRLLVLIACFALSGISDALAKDNYQTWFPFIGSAYTENKSYDMLRRVCDEAGGRVVGSKENYKALDILQEELRKIGFESKREAFKMPGWIRGEDEVRMLEPNNRKLRAIALGFVNATDDVVSELVDAKYGIEENYTDIDVKGKIVLVTQEAPPGKEQPLRYEDIDIAAKHGAKAILLMNDKQGGILLGGVGNFKGTPTPIPAYSITQEEGLWLKRLMQSSVPVKLSVITKSKCIPEIETANIVATLPGKSPKKIVIGAHFDSWDMGNGGVDNGQGSAVLFDVARILNKYSKVNNYTIEFVWFNAEELGLWGSKRYAEAHSDEIAAMINMDMTGSPTGFNSMGYEEFNPLFKELADQLKGWGMTAGVTSQPWTNSDHMYFMFQGIPSFTLHAKLDKEMYQYYHDFGDTFEKVSIRYLSDAAAIVSILAYELSNNTNLKFTRFTNEESKQMMIKYGLDKKLKRQKEWPFGE